MIKRPTAILLILFFLSIGVYFYLDKNPIKPQSTSTPTSTADLFPELKFETIQSIKYIGKNKAPLVLELGKDNSWYLTSENNFPVDWSIAEDIGSTLSGLKKSPGIISQLSLEVLGFTSSSESIEIKTKDGKIFNLTIGKATPTSGGYYIKNQDNQTYILDKYSVETLLEKLSRPSITGTPEPTSSPVPIPTAPPKS